MGTMGFKWRRNGEKHFDNKYIVNNLMKKKILLSRNGKVSEARVLVCVCSGQWRTGGRTEGRGNGWGRGLGSTETLTVCFSLSPQAYMCSGLLDFTFFNPGSLTKARPG